MMPDSPHERRWTICTNCWQVIAINGQPNEDRQTTVCSHLRGVEVMPVPSQPVEDEGPNTQLDNWISGGS